MTKILLVSQVPYGTRKILEVIREVNSPYLKVTIRPHPSCEGKGFNQTYEDLIKELGLKNTTVDNTTPLEEQYKTHHIILGVDSGTLVKATFRKKFVIACMFLHTEAKNNPMLKPKEDLIESYCAGPILILHSLKELKWWMEDAAVAPFDDEPVDYCKFDREFDWK